MGLMNSHCFSYLNHKSGFEYGQIEDVIIYHLITFGKEKYNPELR
jgi:hypothetical protein